MLYMLVPPCMLPDLSQAQRPFSQPQNAMISANSSGLESVRGFRMLIQISKSMFQIVGLCSEICRPSTCTLALVMFLIWIGSRVVDENAGLVSRELLAPNGATPNSTSGQSGLALAPPQAGRLNSQPMLLSASLLMNTRWVVP